MDVADRGLRVRVGTAPDAAVLASVGAQTFFDTYSEDLAVVDMALYLEEAFGEEKQAAELAEAGSCFLIAEKKGVVAGYARLLWSEAPEAVAGERVIELQRLYAVKAWIGQGVGAALMEACLCEAQRQGATGLWLGVWERNERAMRFYEKWGFVVVGEHWFSVGGERHRDILLYRPIAEEKTHQ